MRTKLNPPLTVREQFAEWRIPRRGVANPEVLTNDVWVWLVNTKAWPHAAHEAVGRGERRTPGWCFSRFGYSETRLPDGSIVYVGGEHEDSYDPDFYIYNDVVVVRPDATVEIFGYPVDLFPPTDFHTATLVDNEIYVIGSLGYSKDRRPEHTPVYALNTETLSFRRVDTKGDRPSWLFKHSAVLSADQSAILCKAGQVIHAPTGEFAENITTWKFNLATRAWTIVETKPWTRWLLVRRDRRPNELWAISQIAASETMSRRDERSDEYKRKFADRGHQVDTSLYRSRYSPLLAHEVLPEGEDEYGVHRISIEGVIVRYIEGQYDVAVTVEGVLDSEVLDTLRTHGKETFSRIEGVEYEVVNL